MSKFIAANPGPDQTTTNKTQRETEIERERGGEREGKDVPSSVCCCLNTATVMVNKRHRAIQTSVQNDQ